MTTSDHKVVAWELVVRCERSKGSRIYMYSIMCTNYYEVIDTRASNPFYISQNRIAPYFVDETRKCGPRIADYGYGIWHQFHSKIFGPFMAGRRNLQRSEVQQASGGTVVAVYPQSVEVPWLMLLMDPGTEFNCY